MTTRRSFLSAIPAVLAIPVATSAEPVSPAREPITGVVGLANGMVLFTTPGGKLNTRTGEAFPLDDGEPLYADFYLRTDDKPLPDGLKAHLASRK